MSNKPEKLYQKVVVVYMLDIHNMIDLKFYGYYEGNFGNILGELGLF